MNARLRRSSRLAKRQKTAEHRESDADEAHGDANEGQHSGESEDSDANEGQKSGEGDASEEDEEDVPKYGTFSASVLSQLKTYNAKRTYFERFVAKMDGKGYVRSQIEGGCSMLKEKTLVSEFRDCLVEGKSFIQRWLKDPAKKIVQTVTYDPGQLGVGVPSSATTMNLFQGFAPRLTLLQDRGRVHKLIKPWTCVGKQLCEGDRSKFKLLEQYLAHLVQFPGERTNISFAFVGAKQGTFKNAFFAPLKSILGAHNCIETGNIHQVVDTGKRQHRHACKLLCILDEATKSSTVRYQSQLKIAVTNTHVTTHRSHELPFDVPAHHRLVILSNFIDGLGVDFHSDNRRFVLLQPTPVMASLPSKAKQTFTEEFVKRFVDPGNKECINALYTHLAQCVEVEHRSAAAWEAARRETMANSALRDGTERPPPQAQFLFDYTKPVDGPDYPTYEEGEKDGLYKYVAHEFEDYRYQFEVEISRAALFSEYQQFASTADTMSATQFAQWVRRVLNGSYNVNHDRKFDNGTRVWCFMTQQVHKWLEKTYPGLGRVADDSTTAVVNGIVELIDYNDMFSV